MHRRLYVRDQLIAHAFDRLRRLARRMFHQNPNLRSVVETDDVLQNAALRLHRSLPEVQPENVRRFFGLAAEQVRRELLDLARRYLGPGGAKAERVVFLGSSRSKSHHRVLDKEDQTAAEPSTLEEWTDFHDQIARLPEEERETFDLLFYQGLTQEEAAQVLRVSLRTIKRRWRAAQVLLYQALHGAWPKL